MHNENVAGIHTHIINTRMYTHPCVWVCAVSVTVGAAVFKVLVFEMISVCAARWAYLEEGDTEEEEEG